jgi:hypothetical protein
MSRSANRERYELTGNGFVHQDDARGRAGAVCSHNSSELFLQRFSLVVCSHNSSVLILLGFLLALGPVPRG